MEIPHDLFLITPRNSTSFLIKPQNFDVLFLHQPSKFHVLKPTCLNFFWNSLMRISIASLKRFNMMQLQQLLERSMEHYTLKLNCISNQVLNLLRQGNGAKDLVIFANIFEGALTNNFSQTQQILAIEGVQGGSGVQGYVNLLKKKNLFQMLNEVLKVLRNILM